MINVNGYESIKVKIKRKCHKCKDEYEIVCHFRDTDRFPAQHFTCNECQDHQQHERIRSGLKRMKDPDTGKAYTKQKIELRVRQWQRARDRYRQREEAGVFIVPVVSPDKRIWYE